MTPVAPQEIPDTIALIIAKDQPQYIPLPARVSTDGYVYTSWEPTAEELAQILAGGRIQVTILTCGRPLQPLKVEVIPA